MPLSEARRPMSNPAAIISPGEPAYPPAPVLPSAAAHSPAPRRVLVLGVGNPLVGDDGAGPHVVELLSRLPLPAQASVQDAGLPGWGLVSWFEGFSDVILVDAMQLGLAPGAWRRFSAEQLKLELADEALSLHQPDLACGLALAQALDCLPENLVLYGIQPACLVPGEALSPAVQSCLPEVATRIFHDIHGACAGKMSL